MRARRSEEREAWYRTGFGWGVFRYRGAGITEVRLPRRGVSPPAGARRARHPATVRRMLADLEAYFRGEERAVVLGAGGRLDWTGVPSFERRVYEVVRRIPPGSTMSYRDVARAAGRQKAHRAVGNAMARNPFPVLVPCHRVVRSDGGIGGFGGGVPLKRSMLAIEGQEL